MPVSQNGITKNRQTKAQVPALLVLAVSGERGGNQTLIFKKHIDKCNIYVVNSRGERMPRKM